MLPNDVSRAFSPVSRFVLNSSDIALSTKVHSFSQAWAGVRVSCGRGFLEEKFGCFSELVCPEISTHKGGKVG